MWYNRYVGMPFEEKGRGDAVDCYGLLLAVYQCELGITLPDYLDLYKDTKDTGIADILAREKKQGWHEVHKPKEFDVIVLRMRSVPMHLGIVTKKGYMIHSAEGSNVTHERYDSIRWRSKVVGFERYA